ncbi:MAG: DNA polymerase III subunit gamma/tau, partial [Kordiimonadaceae bacterium]|nr:DNA polymerase III subunit gamma/tau [Kordiimonadaceae bacterium]
GAGDVTEGQVRDMLGLADRAQVLDLFELLMKGAIADAIGTLRVQYNNGADPVVVLSDLLEVSHWLTRLKVTPDTGSDVLVSEAEKSLGGAMAEKLSMPHLTRAWQMLLKGLGEVKIAPSPIAAAEMVLIRLAYAANLPGPAALVKKIQSQSAASGGASGGAVSGSGPVSGGASGNTSGAVTAMAGQQPRAQATSAAAAQAGAPVLQNTAQVLAFSGASIGDDHAMHPMPVDFEKMIVLFNREKEPSLALLLKDHTRLVSYKPGSIEINITRQTPADFLMRVKSCLKHWTGTDWTIAISKEDGSSTVRSQEVARDKKRKDEALQEPLVKAMLTSFPDAKLLAVRDSRLEDVATDGDMPTDPDAAVGDDESADFDF